MEFFENPHCLSNDERKFPMRKILSAALAVGLLMQPVACRAEIIEPESSTSNISLAETAEPSKAPDPENAEARATFAPAEQAPTDEISNLETPTAEIPEETPAPEASATETPTAEATTPEASITQAPTAEAPTTEAPTQEPDASSDEGVVTVSEKEEIPESIEAWFLSDGLYICGSLDKIVARAKAGAEIRLCQADVTKLRSVSLRTLASLKLLPDKRVFGDGKYRVIVSRESPKDTETPEELDLSAWFEAETDEMADLFIWVEKAEDEIAPEPTQQPETEPKIEVVSEDYRAAEWSGVHPTFQLSGIPEGKNWSYAAVIYDERIVVLSEDNYTPEEEGVYTLRFVILDELGDIADASEKYTLCLDHTPPEVSVNIDSEEDYTMHIEMADGMSGLRALSLDGGASWIELNGENSDTYTFCKKTTLEAGMLQVRDVAGNTWVSSESYELKKIPSASSGGSSGSSTSAKQHAKEEADGADVGAEYNALVMRLPDEPMHTLTIDQQELALVLELVSAEGFEISDDYQPTFTAELTAWTSAESAAAEGEQPEATDQKKDTLLLTAVAEENLGDRFEYRWKFNGEVYRLLANSGIRYLALKIEDDMAVFPTEGFVGGAKYTQLKMLGVSTRKFDYTVAMSFNLDPDRIPKLSESDFSENCDMAIQAEVENAKYVLGDEQKGEMYYYNVYLGPKEMLDAPYGAYGARDTEEK